MLGNVAAVVCSCILGAVWYNPKMPTGRLWMRRNYPGKSEAEIGQGSGIIMGLTIVINIFLTLLLRFILIDTFHAKSLVDGAKFGVGLGCLTTLLETPHVLFTRRYMDAFVIDQIYNMLVMVAAGVCIVYFG